ncbi:hypothetical protein GOBAR_AA13581 [Gossypium barbadense]|uniref:Uncharacterized protein n=1 Tax=Gossypium barbadense TaxID=3634 RepID=A0A2P5XUR2_GOSBA|nr:hypothetical protein GOBAR_AA13581 [Gossypium barbadense]
MPYMLLLPTIETRIWKQAGWCTHMLVGPSGAISSVRVINSEGLVGKVVSTLVGHTQHVSFVVWPQYDTIYSASWDHSVRKWDVETGKYLSDIFCGKALNCIDIGGEGLALTAAGGSDLVLRIWNPRKPGTTNYTRLRSKNNLQTAHNDWLLPLYECLWEALQ